jgi:hypothetical protein
VRLGRSSGWHRSKSEQVGKLISARVSEAERWLQTRALLEVERRPMSPMKLGRIRSGRHARRYKAVLDAFAQYRSLAERLDRTAIRNAVEVHGLVSRDDPTLFELLCTFRLLDVLKQRGWRLGRLGLFAGSLRVRGTRGTEKLVVAYQRTPKALSRNSSYRTTLQDHEVPPGPLRPDLVLRYRSARGDRWVVVEAKGGKRFVEESARAATFDLLAYRSAFATALGSQTRPYGLGIVWGAELEPKSSKGVVLCTPDTLPLALERF